MQSVAICPVDRDTCGHGGHARSSGNARSTGICVIRRKLQDRYEYVLSVYRLCVNITIIMMDMIMNMMAVVMIMITMMMKKNIIAVTIIMIMMVVMLLT